MSADNLVYALPFQKMTGQVVWRVLEVRLSSLAWELCYAMSTEARYKQFQEFEGPQAAQEAYAAARRLQIKLPVCEYGATLLPAQHEPLTMATLQRDAVEQGFDPNDVYALREASDDELAQKELDAWADF